MANHRYYAELGVDASEAVKAFGESEKSATSLTNTLDALGTALGEVGKTGEKAAAGQGRTLKLYQQLTSAAGGYGRAMKTLADPAVAKGAREMEGAFRSMRTELDRIAKTPISKEQSEQIGRTLNLYKQLAQVSQTYTASLRNEAAAIKAVSDARARDNREKQAAVRTSTGTDIWGVSKEERDARARAQTVIKAEREMEAEFNSRAEAIMKANREQEAAIRRNTSLQGRAREELDRSNAAHRGLADSITAGNNALFQSREALAEHERGLASTRYALYEVAATYTAISAAAAVLPVTSARAAIEMEAQFAHVARTTQAAEGPLANLRNRFRDLSTEIPVTFEELSKIATLGAQMGIPEAALESFADTVAKFSATTNVSVDQAAMSFGRLSNMMHLTEEDFRNLGSSISELGTASVATESEILAIAEAIATSANMAGFSADQVVGLSTAMASLRIRPEMARGAMQRIFAQINAAVADGTEAFTNYADAMGMTEAAAEDLWRNDPSVFFQRITQAIGEMEDNVARSQFIRDGLGLRNVRDVELLNRLSNGYKVYADSMNLANDAYARGDYLETEASVIFETTAASIERLGSALQAMLASFGDDSLLPIKAAAEVLIALMNAIRDLPAWAKNSAAMLSLMVAAFFGLRASMALAMASMRAFRLVNQNLGISGAVSFRTLRKEAALTFGGIAGGAGTARGMMQALRVELALAPSAFAKARIGAAAFSGALVAMGPVGWITTAATLGSAIWGIANAYEGAAAKARAAAEDFISTGGGVESLVEELRKDAEELASGVQTEVYGELDVRLKETEQVAQSTASALSDVLVPAHDEQTSAVEAATKAYQDGIGAIGKYADTWMRSALAENLGKVLDPDQITSLVEAGFDFERLVTLWQSEGADAARAYTEEFAMGLRRGAGGGVMADIIATLPDSALSERELDQVWRIAEKVGSTIVDLNGGLNEINSTFLVSGELGVEAFDDIEEGAAGAADEVDSLSDSLKELIDDMFGLIDSEAAVYAALDRLGKSLDENGENFNIMTEEGRSNMEALKGYITAIAEDISANVEAGIISAEDGVEAYANSVAQIINELQEMGVDTSQFETFLTDLDAMFAEPIQVQVETQRALNDLADYAQKAIGILNNVAAAAGDSLIGGVARWGAGVAKNISARASATSRRTTVPDRSPPSMYRDMETLAANRTRAAQERLNKEKEKGRSATKDTADQARKLRQEIEDINDPARIFEETMKELSNAFKDTLNDFNNLQSHRDSLEMRLINMREAAQATKDEIRDLREEAAKLRREAAEERVTERQARHFASVAARYGDDLRQEQYTVEAREAAAAAREKERLAKTATNEANALDKNRLSLTGYSKQAIENRNAVRDLQGEMADLIIAYAETGASQQDVERYAEQLRRKFVDQLTQMGYNRRDVRRLSEVFVDLKRDIDRVPRQVRIKAQADTAEARRKIRDLAKTQTVPIKFRAPSQNISVTGDLRVRNVRASEVRTNTVRAGGGGAPYAMFHRGGVIPGTASSSYDNMLGVGHRFDGMVSVRSGEGIVSEPALKRMGGEPWLNAVNSMKAPPPMVVVNTPSGPSTQDVNLLPQNINAIARAVSTVLAVDGKVIAATTNAQNTRAARRGAN